MWRQPTADSIVLSQFSGEKVNCHGSNQGDFPMADSTPHDFDPIRTARHVLRQALTGALATLDERGHPFASLVTVATTLAGAPVLLLSQLAVHTRNLLRDPRASLLLVAPGGETGDPLAGARLTLSGTVAAAPAGGPQGRRFLARHPEAAGYAGFRDFGFYEMSVEGAHLVAGFGRIVTVAAGDLLLDVAPDHPLVDGEAGAVEHMNEDHADAIGLYATRLLGLPAGNWRLTGIDPLGLDMLDGPTAARLDFPAAISGPGELRKTLVALAQEARGQAA